MTALTPASTHGYATAADWARFLKPIVAGVRNPPTEGDFKARAVAIAHALPNVPAIWLTQAWRQREAMTAWQFWPAVADVAEWLAPYQREERATADMRHRLAAPAPEPGRGPRSAAEILAVKQAAAAVMAAATAPQPCARLPTKARPLSDGALLRQYERDAAEGNTIAAYRAACIRARLAQHETQETQA